MRRATGEDERDRRVERSQRSQRSRGSNYQFDGLDVFEVKWVQEGLGSSGRKTLDIEPKGSMLAKAKFA